MSKKKKHGGKREGAGRPEAEDKAEPITVYVRESRIKKIGKETLKEKIIAFIEKLYKKKK